MFIASVFPQMLTGFCLQPPIQELALDTNCPIMSEIAVEVLVGRIIFCHGIMLGCIPVQP